MSSSTLRNIMDFLETAEGLKKLLRHSWLSDGRQESVAEHTWRMALMALALESELEHKVDLGHTLEMILVHDLAEIEAGDHHAWKGKLVGKYEKEEAGLQKIVAKLPKKTAQKIVALWQEFEEAETFEAKFAQAMDKLEVVIQHNHADLETWNEKEHTFNIEYGGERMAFSEMLKAFREIAAEDSRQKLAKAGK